MQVQLIQSTNSVNYFSQLLQSKNDQLRRLAGQQISYQINLKRLNMIFLAINYYLIFYKIQTQSIWLFKFEQFIQSLYRALGLK